MTKMTKSTKPLCTTERAKKNLITKSYKRIDMEPHEKLSKVETNFLYNSLKSGRELNLTDNKKLSYILKHIFKAINHDMRRDAARNVTVDSNNQVWFDIFGKERPAQDQVYDFGRALFTN